MRSHYPSWGSETAGRANRCAEGCKLTTPHGDQKLDVSRYVVNARTCSLPLMGIRNPGIAPVAILPYASSLPLMGIRNRRPLPGSRRQWAKLTTPHGDQKQPTRALTAGTTPLTTPHGDQKPRRLMRRIINAIKLTTPHGDQKPASRSSGRTTARSHYPSWGSETFPVSRILFMSFRLTTPHGDQKHG